MSAVVTALGWSLLHSTWELGAIAVVLAVALRLTRDPGLRHGLAVIALLAMPVAFGWRFWSELALVRVTGGAVGGSGGEVAAVLGLEPGSSRADGVARWLDELVLLWAVGGALSLGYLGLGGWRLSRLRGRCREGSQAIQELADALGSRLGLGPVPVWLSPEVTSPMVTGLIRPVILFPVQALTGLEPEALKGLLLHELAHVRRGDLWVGALQIAIETLLYHHPAVWWVSGRIRAERELCCDDLVVAVGVDRRAYAQALLELAEARAGDRLVAAAAGGILRERLERVLGVAGPRRAPSFAVLGASVLVALGVSWGIAGMAGPPVPQNPVVVHTVPVSGDQAVDPELERIVVRFSADMLDHRWSFVQVDDRYPSSAGPPQFVDPRTIVLPVELEPDREYTVWINDPYGKYSAFADRNQQPAVPYRIAFRTAPR